MESVTDVDCRKMEQLISLYMDGELSRSEVEAVRSHLAVCAGCGQEYESMLQISSALHQFSMKVVPAPAGFASLVMQGIEADKKAIPMVENTPWFQRNWKQAVAGIAAAVMLMAGTLLNSSGPIVQIADNPPSVVQPNNPVTEGETPGGNPSGDAGNIQNPATNNGGAPGAVNGDSVQIAQSPDSAVVFLSKDRALTTTLLEIAPPGSSTAPQKAMNLAAGAQAQVQNLGQQVNDNGSYTVLKITVANSSASGLIASLEGLGTINNKEITKNDITAQFTDKLAQYQNLLSQRSTLQGNDQIAALELRIKALEAELTDWDKRAEQQTIILWLKR